ncbi:MAG TPA: serine/threonine-protein kinase, partial [Pseudomonadota bacterium]|nr:serine/threonine-protein kinase [Pseudomonadota bacterium]
MGTVFCAIDLSTGQEVALKLMHEAEGRNEERFLREAKLLSDLRHPGIVSYLAHGLMADGRQYLVMEWLDGEDLSHRLRRAEPMSVGQILDLVIQVADALAFAHARGIVHRDIKPENVMVRRDGLVKVLDFGLAKPATPLPALLEGTNANSTAPGVILGTLRYMSPEQARGLRVDARTDIFSFGVLLYELLAGRLPFTGRTSSDVLAHLLTAEPPPLPEQVPPELQQIVRQMLGKEPDERYQSAASLLTDLRQLKQRLEHSPEFAAANATNPFLHQL